MKVNEIFYSLQGEGVFTGAAAIFVRLAGCNLHCDFCDTKHEDYTIFTEEEIVKAISDYPAKHVVIQEGNQLYNLRIRLSTDCMKSGNLSKLKPTDQSH